MTAEPVPHRFSVDDYHQMGAAGMLDPDVRTELLEGEVVEMAPIGSRHAACVSRLTRLLVRAVGDDGWLSPQNPVRLDHLSEPQPDVAVLRPRPDDYAASHARPDEVLLLVEVADSSVGWDRRYKLPLYARAGIAEAWLVDLVAGVVEVCREPGPSGYGQRRAYDSGETLSPQAFPGIVLAVDDILPA